MLPNRPQSPIKRQLEVHNPQNCKGNSTPESDPVAARSACRRGQVSLSLSGLRIGLPSLTGVKCEPTLWWWEGGGGGVAASYAIVIHAFLLGPASVMNSSSCPISLSILLCRLPPCVSLSPAVTLPSIAKGLSFDLPNGSKGPIIC